MYYKTCFNCGVDKSTCARRAEIRDGIQGLGLTSVKFKCDERKPRFRTGQRVEFEWRIFNEEEAYYDLSGEEVVEFVGTVLMEKRDHKRFVVRVDQTGDCYDALPADVFKSPEFVGVRPDDMKPIAEPDREMCEKCGAYVGDEEDTAKRCYNSQYMLVDCPNATDPDDKAGA